MSGIVIIFLENNRAGLETFLSFSLYLMSLHYKTFNLPASMTYSLAHLCDRCRGSSREARNHSNPASAKRLTYCGRPAEADSASLRVSFPSWMPSGKPYGRPCGSSAFKRQSCHVAKLLHDKAISHSMLNHTLCDVRPCVKGIETHFIRLGSGYRDLATKAAS